MKNSINNILAQLKGLVGDDVLAVINELLSKYISIHTKKALISDLKHFFQWYKATNDEIFKFSRLATRDISDYKLHCLEKSENAASTINRRLTSIKTICKAAIKAEKIEKDPSIDVKQLPLEALAPKSLTKREWRTLLKEAELIAYPRDILILEMLLGAGLRASEIINIKIKNIEISERKGFLRIYNSKGGKSRKVPLNQQIRKLTEKHKKDLAEFNECQPDDYLFQGQRTLADGKKRLHTPLAVNKIVEVYANKAGIKCSPHSLRHTFSYNYLKDNPGDIVGLQKILGHSNLNTTAIYTQQRLEDLQEGVERMQY